MNNIAISPSEITGDCRKDSSIILSNSKTKARIKGAGSGRKPLSDKKEKSTEKESIRNFEKAPTENNQG